MKFDDADDLIRLRQLCAGVVAAIDSFTATEEAVFGGDSDAAVESEVRRMFGDGVSSESIWRATAKRCSDQRSEIVTEAVALAKAEVASKVDKLWLYLERRHKT